MNSAEKAALYHELAKMTGADFHFDRTVSMLLTQRPGKARRKFLEGVQRGLASGDSVAEAVASAGSGRVTPLEASMVEAGEKSGRLSDAFDHLAHYFKAVEDARKESWRAMQYPLLLLHLAILLPEIPKAIATADTQGSGVRIAMAIGGLWVGIFLCVVVWRWVSNLARTSAAVDGALAWLPFVGKVRKHWALARFSQVLYASLLAALRISRAVQLAGDASQSGRFRRAAAAAARRIEAGETVAGSLKQTSVFPREFVDTIGTAEEVGGLDDEMARWAALQTELATNAIQRAATWLPKIGYALVTVYVVYRIYGMMSGYYDGLIRQFEL